MEYTIKFNFNCVNKYNKISNKNGEVNITTETSPELLKTSKELIDLIISDMARKTKQSILSVDITSVN